MSAAIVQLTGIGYSYGESPVLEDVTFRVEARDFFGIIGPNGAGKTTLLKIMLGLLAPTRGSVRLFGTSPPEFRDLDPPHRRGPGRRSPRRRLPTEPYGRGEARRGLSLRFP
jgi:ABC-type transporter Mla maintaining outer membrane lipid asymmetry ATPase subunit MlaF